MNSRKYKLSSLYIMRTLITIILVVTGFFSLQSVPVKSNEQIITSDPESGPVGTIVSINGMCFTPSVLPGMGTDTTKIYLADIYFPDKDTLVETTAINTWGNLITDITIGEYPADDYTIWIHDREKGDLGWLSVPFTVVPEINISQSSGYEGDTISITGTGFHASCDIDLYFNSKKRMTAETDERGSFTITSFMIPNDSKPENTIKIIDWFNTQSTESFTAYQQKVTVYPSSSTSGKEISISGSGYAAGTAIQLKLYNTSYLYTEITTDPEVILTDETGNFSAIFTIPLCPSNSYVIEANDGSSRAGTTLNVIASGDFNRSIGYIGSDVTFNGTGFIPDKFTVLSFDDLPVIEGFTDFQGTAILTFTVPSCSLGEHFIKVTDGTVTQLYTFTVISKANIELNRKSGYPGSEIIVNGTGFQPNKVATIMFDDTVIEEIIISSSGNLTSTFIVPACAAGSHTISVSDDINTQTTDFYNGREVPTVPSLITPNRYTVSRSEVLLSWQSVSDNPDTTYTVQISGDPFFATDSLLDTAVALTSTDYTFLYQAENASLQKATVFWRVKADNKNISGDWSETREIILNLVPEAIEAESEFVLLSFAPYAEIGILVLLITFWFIRNRRVQVEITPEKSGA